MICAILCVKTIVYTSYNVTLQKYNSIYEVHKINDLQELISSPFNASIWFHFLYVICQVFTKLLLMPLSHTRTSLYSYNFQIEEKWEIMGHLASPERNLEFLATLFQAAK